MTLKVLMFGDVVGRLGRQALKEIIPSLKIQYQPDLIIANVENIAHGTGATLKTLEEVEEAGIDFCSSGNDIWKKEEIFKIFQDKKRLIIRPANFPSDMPGDGFKLVQIGQKKVLVVNLLGRDFIQEHADCPFRTIDKIIDQYKNEKSLAGIIVDFHAETTSEKAAFGWHVQGRVAAVLGTHTHVGTVDAKILPGGTAFVTDIGLVGARDSVIGVDKKNALKKFLQQVPVKFEMVEEGVVTVNAIYLEIDGETGQAKKIQRVDNEVLV